MLRSAPLDCANAGSDRGAANGEALGLLLSFALLTLAAALGATDALDRGVSRAVRDRSLPWLDALATPLKWLGSPQLTAALVLVLVALIAPAQSRRAAALFVAFAGLVAVEILLKRWLPHQGVPANLDLDRLLSPGGSYPSGHAARVVFLAVTLSNLVRRPGLWVLLAGWVLLTVSVALYAGWHWPSDLAGGALLGYAAATLVRCVESCSITEAPPGKRR
jgi:membrane-associated phospholipid phosphatase